MAEVVKANRFSPLPCTHHFLLPSTPFEDSSPTMTAVCKLCGEVRLLPKEFDADPLVGPLGNGPEKHKRGYKNGILKSRADRSYVFPLYEKWET